MCLVLGNMADWIWTESFWLPHNLTWEDVEPTPENGLANIHHLWYSVLGAFVCTLLKYVIEMYVEVFCDPFIDFSMSFTLLPALYFNPWA